MTDPAGGAPTPPPPEPTPAPPPAAAPPPAGAPPSSWQSPPPQTPTQFQAAPLEAGPAPGVAYADLVTRIIALIIDGVILFVISFVIGIIFAAIGVAVGVGLLFALLGGLVSAAISLGYFVYTWTTMRASPGQKVLNLETVNAADGATLTQNQAIKRWVYLFGLYAVSGIIPILGLLILVLAVAYAVYLLYTANLSPKRQGFHDVQAGTVVVKRG